MVAKTLYVKVSQLSNFLASTIKSGPRKKSLHAMMLDASFNVISKPKSRALILTAAIHANQSGHGAESPAAGGPLKTLPIHTGTLVMFTVYFSTAMCLVKRGSRCW
ncbi:hypothetical protein QL093DRAFT_2107560 [Fusarium oxysporum]|nr:hypothetical protein QL093DRAFT_2107560 [Fusarium oxysporum]